MPPRAEPAAGGRYPTLALLVVLVGLFSAGFTITILGNSLPRIAKDLGAEPSSATWVLTGQLLTMAVLVPLTGKLGDTLGHRRVYLGGFAVFALMAIPTALAPNVALLVVFRVLGAAGGAATSPTSMAILMHNFHEERRVRALGWWQLVGAGAPVIGLVVGGPVVDTFGWRWIFVGQAVLSAFAWCAAYFVLRETPTRPAGRFDVAGACTLAVGIVCLLLAMQLLRTDGVGPVTVVLLGAAIVLLVSFARVEARAGDPLLPPVFFRSRNFSASLVAQFGANFAYMGSFIVTPLLVQQRFGYTTAQSGLAMALRPLTFSIVAPIAGYLAARAGGRRLATLGTSIVALGMLAFVVAAARDDVTFVFVGLAGAGVGMGLASPSLLSAVGNAVAPDRLGTANAAQGMVAQLGVVVGMGLMSSVQASAPGSAGFAWAYVCALVMAVTGALGAAALRDAAPALEPALLS
jgi:EmrB/QacA subfamily drug resistance transporter